jgi:hypothetical protein
MATTPVQGTALSARLRDRRFYLFTTILTAALVFAGFARTFYLNGFFAKMHLPLLFIVHGVVFSSWLVVFFTQSVLVSAKEIRVHQKLGYASIAIVVAMFILGWIMSVQAAQRGFTRPGVPQPLSFLAFSFLVCWRLSASSQLHTCCAIARKLTNDSWSEQLSCC